MPERKLWLLKAGVPRRQAGAQVVAAHDQVHLGQQFRGDISHMPDVRPIIEE